MKEISCRDCKFCGLDIVESGRERDYIQCYKYGQAIASEANVCRSFEPSVNKILTQLKAQS